MYLENKFFLPFFLLRERHDGKLMLTTFKNPLWKMESAGFWYQYTLPGTGATEFLNHDQGETIMTWRLQTSLVETYSFRQLQV